MSPDYTYYSADMPTLPAAPSNAWDILHPYYRTKVADVLVPGIALLGLGFVGYTTYNTYFKGVDTKKEFKESVGKLWTNMQGGLLGAMSFTLLLGALVALQHWIRGKSLPKSVNMFTGSLKDATGQSQLT